MSDDDKLLTRIYVAKFAHYPDVQSVRDLARLKELAHTLAAIRAAGFAVVEGEDGR
jgi:hypothetical protein